MKKIHVIQDYLDNLILTYEINKALGPEYYLELEIAKRYWLRDVEGNWVFDVSEVARAFGIKESEVTQKVCSLIHAEYEPEAEFELDCAVCGSNTYLVTREDFQNSHNFYNAKNTFVCHLCLKTEDLVTA